MEKESKWVSVKADLLQQLHQLSKAILDGDYSKRVVVEVNDDDLLNSVVIHLNMLADKMLVNPPDIDGTEQKINISHFIEAISSFANRDFNHKLPISENGTILDAIAIGINTLGDELEESTASKYELEEERNRLNEAQTIAMVGSWEFDLRNNELNGSKEFYRIFELEGIPFHQRYAAYRQRFHPEDLFKLDDTIQEVIQEGEGFMFEHRLVSSDGTIKHLSCIGEAIFDQEYIIGLKGTVQDITDRKIAEIQLNNSFNTMMEQNKRLMNFSYIVSHNLRSHTSNIKSLLSLLEITDLKEEREQIMTHMMTVSDLLNETIVNLNDVVSIQNNTNLTTEPLRLVDYVNQGIKVLREQIIAQDAVVLNKVPESMIVQYSPAYLESIVLNFLSNAIKYSHPERRPEISINSYREDGRTVLEFKDNGIGIDMKRHGDKLFGMYKTFTTHKDARGIGLFITKNQIETMGGKIEVESELNKGTTFKIYMK